MLVACAGLTLGPTLLILDANHAVEFLRTDLPGWDVALNSGIKEIETHVLRCADGPHWPIKKQKKSPTFLFSSLAGGTADTGLELLNHNDLLLWAFKVKLPLSRGISAVYDVIININREANDLKRKSHALCRRFEYLEGKELKEREALVQNLLAEALPKLEYHQKQLAEARKLYESDRPWIKLLYYLLLTIQVVGWGLYPFMMRRLIRNYREHRAARKKAQAK